LTDEAALEENYAAISMLRDLYSKKKVELADKSTVANTMKANFEKMMAERKREDDEYWSAKKEEDDLEAAFEDTKNRKNQMITKKAELAARITGYETKLQGMTAADAG